MKTAAIFATVCIASASAFAPSSFGRAATQLAAEKKAAPEPEKKSFFSIISGMNLFNPATNQYGARAKKNLTVGKISDNSYIPAGLTKAKYEAIRKAEKIKKDTVYQKNVAKAGKFLGYDEFYNKRGTELDQAWKKSPTLGHLMVKTKYDWTGKKSDTALYTGIKVVEDAAKAKSAAKKK